jgi:hypothetical protein
MRIYYLVLFFKWNGETAKYISEDNNVGLLDCEAVYARM